MRPNFETNAHATTKTARPRAMAKMRRNASPPAPLRGDGRGPKVLDPGPALACASGRDDTLSADGCATTTRFGSALTYATLTLNPPAYFTGSLPSHTTPSRSFDVRMRSFGTETFAIAAACL